MKTEEIEPYFHCRSELSVKENIVLKDCRPRELTSTDTCCRTRASSGNCENKGTS